MMCLIRSAADCVLSQDQYRSYPRDLHVVSTQGGFTRSALTSRALRSGPRTETREQQWVWAIAAHRDTWAKIWLAHTVRIMGTTAAVQYDRANIQ